MVLCCAGCSAHGAQRRLQSHTAVCRHGQLAPIWNRAFVDCHTGNRHLCRVLCPSSVSAAALLRVCSSLPCCLCRLYFPAFTCLCRLSLSASAASTHLALQESDTGKVSCRVPRTKEDFKTNNAGRGFLCSEAIIGLLWPEGCSACVLDGGIADW